MSWKPLVLGAGLLAGCSSGEARDEAPVPGEEAVPDRFFSPAAEYLGEALPGDTAVLFAPGRVSVEGRFEYGVSFSPEKRDLLFTGHAPGRPAALIHIAAREDGSWAEPRQVRLAEGRKAEEMEAFFTPDGRRIYFAAYDEGMDVRIWAVDREKDGWHSPRPLPPPLADDPAFFPSTTADGAVYYPNLSQRRIFRATLAGDSVVAVEDTGLEAMHAFIAPDESFVLLDARLEEGGDPDIYVSFRRPDGSWSEARDLGPGVNTGYSETCPSLSPDGRFIFFSRYNEAGEVSNIYWVSSVLIERARGGPADPP